jgi:hypothetical protein
MIARLTEQQRLKATEPAPPARQETDPELRVIQELALRYRNWCIMSGRISPVVVQRPRRLNCGSE